jgi:glycosyltransferase involved in cell wall biosynthesis
MNSLCVLIPVFNNQEGLEQTCESLAAAEGHFDVLVVDDGSRVPVEITTEAVGNRRVLLHRLAQNGGITKALNQGLRVAQGLGYRYIGRVDSSDAVHPSRFQRQLDHLNRNEHCGIVGSYIQFVGMDRSPLFLFTAPAQHRDIARRMQAENCLIHSGVTMRASVIQQVGGYRESCLTSEDYDLFLRIIQASEAAVLPMALTSCEYNLAGISIMRRRKQQRERLSLQIRYFQPLNWFCYYGMARTCFAMAVPHGLVLRFKRTFFGGSPAIQAS